MEVTEDGMRATVMPPPVLSMWVENPARRPRWLYMEADPASGGTHWYSDFTEFDDETSASLERSYLEGELYSDKGLRFQQANYFDGAPLVLSPTNSFVIQYELVEGITDSSGKRFFQRRGNRPDAIVPGEELYLSHEDALRFARWRIAEETTHGTVSDLARSIGIAIMRENYSSGTGVHSVEVQWNHHPLVGGRGDAIGLVIDGYRGTKTTFAPASGGRPTRAPASPSTRTETSCTTAASSEGARLEARRAAQGRRSGHDVRLRERRLGRRRGGDRARRARGEGFGKGAALRLRQPRRVAVARLALRLRQRRRVAARGAQRRRCRLRVPAAPASDVAPTPAAAPAPAEAKAADRDRRGGERGRMGRRGREGRRMARMAAQRKQRDPRATVRPRRRRRWTPSRLGS